MARIVREIPELLNAFMELEHDAVDALCAASKRLSRLADKVELGAIVAQHRRHIAELADVVKGYGAEPHMHGDARLLLARGRVLLGAIGGDAAILKAAAAIETGGCARYQRALELELPRHVSELLARHRDDAARHVALLAVRAGVAPPARAARR